MKRLILFCIFIFPFVSFADCKLSDWKIVKTEKPKTFNLSSSKTSIPLPYYGIKPELTEVMENPSNNGLCIFLFVSSSSGTNSITEEIRAVIIDTKINKSLGIVLNELRSIPDSGIKRKAQWTWTKKKIEILEPGKKIPVSISI